MKYCDSKHFSDKEELLKMTNPRKFSDKLEIIKRREAEANEAFVQIMREVSDARKGPAPYIRQKYKGGSLPNVNNYVNSSQLANQQNMYANSISDFFGHQQQQQQPHSYRYINAHPRRNMDPPAGPIFPSRNKVRSSTVMSPYNLSQQQAIIPEQNDTPSWRRTYSDSAIQQTLQQPPKKHSDVNEMGNGVQRTLQPTQETQDMQNYQNSSPVSLNFNDSSPNKSHIEMQANTSSLPDLSNLSIPSPIQNPIDVEHEAKNSTNHDVTNPYTVPYRGPRRSLGKQVYPRHMTSNPDVLETLQREKLHLNDFPVLNMEKNDLSLPAGVSSSAPLSPVTPPPFYWSSTPMSPLAAGDLMQQGPTDLQQQLQQFQIHSENRGNNGMVHPPPYPSYTTDNDSYNNYYSNSSSFSPKQNVYRINSGPAQLTSNNSRSLCDRQLESALMRVKAQDNNELSEADLDSVRVALDPLDFDAVRMLTNENTEIVDQSAEEQFRMERYN
ncbi:CREB-regulated transcription coactivator 3-like isoform X1 [Hydractinia symbiolongicarpus]|uniref:CREB-regulated transcription coactivator 3-like isoform X1 n=2 Tax=Hydractinia symbiolongicarpus TaxID=13093 RepID=UPI0025516514|nr:CREB-regulated transcription coactivator 3-like isoform X1 [Hydractinia symbiolongicarpus]